MGICRSDGSGLCNSRNCLQNRDEKLQGKFAEREKGAVTMIVQTKKEAWEAAKNIFKANYHKDEKISYYAGYPIYISDISNTNDKISDLGARLEVKVGGKTTNIWIVEQKTESEIEKKMDIIEEQCAIIADDFERYAEDMREDGAFIYDMSKEYVNRTFAIMQFMSMTRDFIKKGIEIINELNQYKEVE